MDKKKMKLKLNSLKVKSFITDDHAEKIKAGIGATGTNCIFSCIYDVCEPQATLEATCPNTCRATCVATCEASCNGTCGCTDPCYETIYPLCPSQPGQFFCVEGV